MEVTASGKTSTNEEDANKLSYQRAKYNHRIPLKKFVRANRTEGNESTSSGSEIKRPMIVFGNGKEIKKSYLQIVGSDSLQSDNTANVNYGKTSEIREQLAKKKKKKLTLSSNVNVNVVMKAVEANDVKKVKELLDTSKSFVLNVKDQYGWSALMCASCAGAKDVVKLLLSFGPDLNVTDKKGNTCLLLAEAKGHHDIVTLLNEYIVKSNSNVEVASKRNDRVNLESIYCDVCKETISEGLVESHFTSTVHLFNSSRKSGVPTSYGIPEHNVGFQMLLKTGWDKERGLGPEGSGHKFPPKIMLKQDRTGLGAKKYVPRVTHDPHVIIRGHHRETQRTLNRRQRLKNELRNKNKEIELRRLLN